MRRCDLDTVDETEALTRRQWARRIVDQPRPCVGCTNDSERSILKALSESGLEVRASWLHRRGGQQWKHRRVVRLNIVPHSYAARTG